MKSDTVGEMMSKKEERKLQKDWAERAADFPEELHTMQDFHLWTVNHWAKHIAYGNILSGGFEWFTRAEIHKLALSLGSAMLRRGIKHGDRVGIFSENRYEAIVVLEACHLFGFISVITFSPGTYSYPQFSLEDADVAALFVSPTRACLPIFESINLPSLKFKILIESDPEVIGTTVLFDELAHEEILPLPHIDPEDICTICYSSGTAGAPKGVLLSHRSMVMGTKVTDALVDVDYDIVHVSYLPFAHILERLAILLIQYRGGRIVFASHGTENLMEDYQRAGLTGGTNIPMVLSKVYTAIKEKTNNSRAFSVLFKFAKVCRFIGFRSRLTDLMFKKVRDSFGGRLEWQAVAGDTFDKEIHEFMEVVLDAKLITIYGLSECGGPVAACRLRDTRPGTVGIPALTVETKITEEGEVLVRSPLLFSGYWNNKELTQNAFIDGFFRTGDRGYRDKGGSLIIPGRLYEMVGIELAIPYLRFSYRLNPCIEDIFIWPIDNLDCLVGIVKVKKETLEELYGRSLTEDEYIASVTNPQFLPWLHDNLERFVTDSNMKDLARLKSIRITTEPFTIENGFLTATGKLRMRYLAEHFANEIAEMTAEIGRI